MTLTLNLFLIFTFFVIFTYVGLTFARVGIPSITQTESLSPIGSLWLFQRDFIVEHKNCTTRGCYPGIWGNCSVTKLPKGRTSLSLSTAVDLTLPNLFATVELYLVKPSSKEKYFIFNSSLADICALLRNRKPGNLIEVVFQMMKRNAQLPEKCPIMAVSTSISPTKLFLECICR